MPIHFRCPHCDKLLAIGTRKAGTQLLCPLCAQLLTVPPRTEVNLPTTIVAPPDLAPTEPASAADAWWLTTPSSVPAPAAPALTAAPEPSARPPLSEASVPSPEPALAPLRAWTRIHVYLLTAGVIAAVIGGMVILLLTRTP